MTDALLHDFFRFAVELVSEAGALALAHFGAAQVRQKPDGTEVTDADVAIQDRIVARIADRHHNHAIVAEETLAVQADRPHPAHARYCWVIDPVDGTRNFIRGFPVFATSVAVLEEGRPVVGVTRWHHTRQVFAAVAGAPTTLDGAPVSVSHRPLGSNLLVGAQLGAHHGTRDIVTPWLGRVAVRDLGATAVHLGLVASGGLDAAYAKDCRIWDLAAGALLVEQAGGRCTDLRGGPLFPVDPATCAEVNCSFIAGGPEAHRFFLDDLRTRVQPQAG